MLKMMILLSNALPTEVILDKLKSAITEWQINPTDENLNHIQFNAHLFFMKTCRDKDDKSGQKMVSEVERLNSFMNVFKSVN